MDKLFITDLDGTALGGNYKQYARFPDSFSEFLDKLTENSYRWGINTTWDVNGQWNLVNISSVKSKPTFMMAEFGRRMAKSTDNGPQFIQPYTDKMAVKLEEFCKHKFSILIRNICGNFNAERIFYYGHLFQFVVAPNDDLDEFTKFVEKFVEDDKFVCNLKQRSFSVRPAFLNKYVPLKEVQKKRKLSPDQVIVAGDEPADIDMMNPEIATHYICPANASEQVKKHVYKYNGEVAELPYGNGVIQAFNRLSKRYNWRIN
jgi:hydroxymethylpyrimidine pyrophosphatase-like HAD family hydrolase